MYSGYFSLAPRELQLESALIGGQAFRWFLQNDGWWACAFCPASEQNSSQQPNLVRVKQLGHDLYYESNFENVRRFVGDYFRLETDLVQLARQLSEEDANFGAASDAFPGVRILRQDPVEALFSFICAAAAPLHRIRRNIAGLCRNYGRKVGIGDCSEVFAFPTVDRLASADVADLRREIGLGYRARYIQQAAEQVVRNGGSHWLQDLRKVPYPEAKAALLTLAGIGEKIADCICLFSLDKDMAVPVDTHIWRIARRDYGAGVDAASLTKSAYAQIGAHFRHRFGDYAGWAQQFLFFREIYGKGSWETYMSLWREPNELPVGAGHSATLPQV